MPKNLQTLFVILKRLRGGRLLTLELHSESWVLDRITFPDDVLLSMHHKKLPSTRFQLQCFLFQGLTDSGIYYHCHHPRVACGVLLSCLCSGASVLKWTWWRWQCQCVFGITLQFTILVEWSAPMSPPPSSGKVNIIVQEKKASVRFDLINQLPNNII
jgi:hypothetical protein